MSIKPVRVAWVIQRSLLRQKIEIRLGWGGATPARVIPWNHDPTWMFSQSHNRNWAGYSSMHLNGSWEWNPIKNCLESSKKLKSEHLYGLILSLWSTKIIQKYFETDFVTMLDGVMEWTKNKTAVCFFAGKLLSNILQVETMDSKILWTDLDISTTHWLMQCKIPSSFSTNCSKLSIYIIDAWPNFQENYRKFTISSMPRMPSAAPAERRKSFPTERSDASLCICPLSARTSVSKPTTWCKMHDDTQRHSNPKQPKGI